MSQLFPSALLETLRKARSIAVLTGAGISAESGVPTFRDAQTGLWAKFKPEELATAEAFLQNPKMVWEWYRYRFDMVRTVQPNPGHYALAEMERRVSEFTLVTQNIDGLHQKAGSRNVQELHGNIQRYKCFEDNQAVESWAPTEEMPPKCPRCGGMIRPDIVWFGESLPDGPYVAAHLASETCDVFFSIGTSAVVFPAAALPGMALRAGAVVVEINPERTPLTAQATYAFQMPSGQLLPELVKAAWGAVDSSKQ
jgi:NAD-dependent deacetylase